MTTDSPYPDEPIEKIEWLPAAEFNANGWNPNRVHKAEIRLLEHSLLTTGWLQPILATPTRMIIDGFHRWRLSQDSPAVARRWGGLVPVATLDVTDDVAMAITVRINRAKGTHVAVSMAALVTRLLTEFGWSRERVAEEIGATLHEVDVLAQESVFTNKKIGEWAYSPAWYPVET